VRLLTAYERTYQPLLYGLPAAGCPPKSASSSSAWKRPSRSVRSSIHDPA